MKPKILILGAGYAGVMAANRLDKQLKEAEITLVSESTTFQERIRFHEMATQGLKGKIQIQDLLRTKVRFIQGKISEIVPKEKSVKLEGNSEYQRYDYLVISLGSSQIQSLYSKEGSIQSKEAVSEFLKKNKEKNFQNICIIGGGLTGIEMATEWKYFFPHSSVTILDRKEWGSSFSEKGKKYLRTYMLQNNIQVLENVNIHRVHEKEIELEDQKKLVYDCILNCSGFLASSLAKKSGFKTNQRNQVYVDSFLRSNEYPDVFVAGDLAYLENSILRMGCVIALPMGAYIADQLARLIKGKSISPFSFQFAGRCVSLGREEGLIQFTSGDDKPKELIIKGRWGARIKELVNRFTIFSLQMEKLLPFRFYFWPKGDPIKFEKEVLKKSISWEGLVS